MFNDRPAVFNIIPFMFRKGTIVLEEGVTYRFLEAIKELKSRSLMLKGTLKQPKGKSIITKVELSDEYLDKIAKEKKAVVVNKTKTIKKIEEPIVEVAENPVVEPAQKTTTKKTTTPKTEGEVKTTTKNNWLLSKKCEDIHSDNIIYIFVGYKYSLSPSKENVIVNITLQKWKM